MARVSKYLNQYSKSIPDQYTNNAQIMDFLSPMFVLCD